MPKIINEKGTFDLHELCGYGFWSEDNRRFFEKETKWLVAESYQAWLKDKKNWPGFHNQLNIVGAAPTAGTRTMLWEVGRKVIGGDVPNIAQEIGDCVSWGCRNAICYIQFFPMANGHRAVWKDVFPPYLYGCGRILIGNNQLGSQDGSIGSWQAQACMKYGTIALDEKTSGGASLPPYSGSVARQWGNRPGPSKDWQNVGVEHLVKTTAPVKTWEEYCQAIANGYAVTIASNVGFDMTIRSDGFNHYSTTWGHQLCLLPQTVISKVIPSTIENAEVGDFVLGHDGLQHIVTKKYQRQYSGDIVVIDTYGVPRLHVTPNHPVQVFRDVEGFDYDSSEGQILVATHKKAKVWVNAEDVATGDILVCPKPTLGTGEAVTPEWINRNPNRVKNVPRSLVVDDDIAWLFGMHVADGYADQGHKVQITLSGEQQEYADRCVLAFSKLGLESFVKHHGRHIRVTCQSAVLADSFYAWFGKGSDKHLPEWLFDGWPLQEIVDGLFAGDGNLIPGSPDFRRVVNTSRVLMEQLRTILLILGYNPSLKQRNHNTVPDNWSDIWVVEWRVGGRKSIYNKWDGDDFHLKVRSSTREHYEGEVFNLEVEGCHSYIANGVTVHNCGIGYDDDPGDPYGCIRNSWGDVHGHIKDFKTGDTWPVGTLRVRKKDIETMLQADDSFAYSMFDGFPAQELPRELFNPW